MDIKGIEGLSHNELQQGLNRGGRFVTFQYCISIVIMTFRRGTDVYYIPPGGSAIGKGLGFSLLTLVAGWWGIPWGPIYTIGSLITNFGGGEDVTNQVRGALGV